MIYAGYLQTETCLPDHGTYKFFSTSNPDIVTGHPNNDIYLHVDRRAATFHPEQIKITHSGLPQRGDGVVHYLAYFVHRNTDVVVLSMFSSLESVSVYTVYHAVISVLEQQLGSISSGIASKIGSLWAREECDQLNETVNFYELCNTAMTFAIGVVCWILILPFVSIYTAGVAGTNYHRPIFASMLICGSMVHCLKMPYHITITAAGHYKEKKWEQLSKYP